MRPTAARSGWVNSLYWRRRNADFAGHLKTYLFTEAPIVGIERAVEAGGEAGAAAPRTTGKVTIGSLKGAG